MARAAMNRGSDAEKKLRAACSRADSGRAGILPAVSGILPDTCESRGTFVSRETFSTFVCTELKTPRGGLETRPTPRMNHTLRIGTSVELSRYDAIIAKATAIASGAKSARAAPTMKNAGVNTASTQSIASRRGTAVSVVAS